MAQVSENRSELRDAVMHDDIIREKGRLLRRRKCGMRDVGTHKELGRDLNDGIGAGNSHSHRFCMSTQVFAYLFMSISFFPYFLCKDCMCQ